MRIVTRCRCRQKVSVKQSWAGRKVKCPRCESLITIPNESDVESKASSSKNLPKKSGDSSSAYIDSSDLSSGSGIFKPGTGNSSGEDPQWINSRQQAPTRVIRPTPSYIRSKKPMSILGTVLGAVNSACCVIHLIFIFLFGFVIYRGFSTLERMDQEYSDDLFADSIREQTVGMMAMAFFLAMVALVFILLLAVGAVGLFQSKKYGWTFSMVAACVSFFFTVIHLGIAFSILNEIGPFGDSIGRVSPMANATKHALVYALPYCCLTALMFVLLLHPSSRKFYLSRSNG